MDVPSIRPAASAICVRDGRDGDPEVLVVERSAASRFLPGYVAFPGGAVEPADESSAARWFGNGGEVQRAAAIRELIEEVGLALTAGGLIRSGSPQQVDEMPPAADFGSLAIMPDTSNRIARKSSSVTCFCVSASVTMRRYT